MKRLRKVCIEISNVCNLRCGFRPEVAPLAEEACLHLMGEPLTHPLFAEFVALAAARGLPLNLTKRDLARRGPLPRGAAPKRKCPRIGEAPPPLVLLA